MFGKRVPKTHFRVEAYGSVDELNAVLGIARASGIEPFIAEAIFSIQKDLVILMGELAVAHEDRERYEKAGYGFVQTPMVDRLTALVDDLEVNHKISFKHWATPGATPGAAALDLARTVCRRAERRVVEITEKGEAINPEIVRYLNRLSDLCWLYARFIETKLPE
jgi:cob(I)alamin adenosyltransferase